MRQLFQNDEENEIPHREREPEHPLVGKLRQAYKEVVGEYKHLMQQRRIGERQGREVYSLSLLAAISQERFEAA